MKKKQLLLESKSEEDQAGLRPNKALFIRKGQVHPTTIIEEAESRNSIITWVIRILGFLCMMIGLYLILNPVVTVIRVIPFLGNFFSNLLAVGIFFVVFIVTLIITCVIVSLAWVFARPFVTLGVVSFGVGLFLLITFIKKHH